MNNIKESYNKNGYHIAKSSLDQSQIDNIISSISFVLKQQLRLLSISFAEYEDSDIDGLYNKMSLLFQADLARYIKVIKSLSNLKSVYELFFSRNIKNLLEQMDIHHSMVPTGPVLHIMSSDLKIPNGYYGLPPHQDYPSMCGSIDAPILWIPLVDIDKNLYPLELIPQSHKKGVLPGKISENCYEIDNSYYQESDFIKVEVEKRDAVIMSPFTIHRSGLYGKNNNVRISCSIRFDNIEEKNFIERAYPTAYKRVIDREMFQRENLINKLS